MATPKLKLPPGFYKDGTEYSGAGRYIDGNLVRWHNEVIKPINGWQQRYDFASGDSLDPLYTDPDEAIRSGAVIGDFTEGVDIYLGSNNAIYHVSNANTVTDVTPASFVPQSPNAAAATGYGTYKYSFGKYGTPRPGVQQSIPKVFSWGFGEWGSWPLAVARGVTGSPIYVKTDLDATFVEVASSPEGTLDVLVTDDRIVMTIGSVDDYRLVQWSDQEDYTEWTAAIDNQAGDKRLAGTGKLLRGVKVLEQVLILGENDAFACQYIGPPYIYGFNRVGNRCGVVGAEAVAVTDTAAYWMSDLGFWQFDGTVKPLACEVIGHFLKTRNRSQLSKTCAFTVSDYFEVWWLYQSLDSSDVDSYIIYNYAKNVWYTGKLDRTFGVDSDPLDYPLMVSRAGLLYDHEVASANRGGEIAYIETGPLETENGHRLTAVSWVYPDFEPGGAIDMGLKVRDMPNQPVRYERNFELLNPTSTHGIAGRDVRMRLSGRDVTPNWFIGDFRVETLDKTPTPGR